MSGSQNLWLIGALAAAAAGAGVLLVGRMATAGAVGFLRMQERLARSDLATLFVFLDKRVLAWASLSSGLLLTVLIRWTGLPWALACAGLAIGLIGPQVIVRRMRKRRNRRLTEQFPDALQMWAGLLTSGHGVQAALLQLSMRQSRPLGDELRLLVRQCRLGMPIEDAMEGLCRRVDITDLSLVSTLLRVTRSLGGNLGEPLLRVSTVLRERLATEGRIRALTSQGQLQGLIVGVLPLLLMVVLWFMDPQSMSVLIVKPFGWAALALIIILETIGFLLIRRIVNIDV